MTAFTRKFVDLKCNGCGRETTLLAKDAADARKKARSWKFGRGNKGKAHYVYDACPNCQIPEGFREI